MSGRGRKASRAGGEVVKFFDAAGGTWDDWENRVRFFRAVWALVRKPVSTRELYTYMLEHTISKRALLRLADARFRAMDAQPSASAAKDVFVGAAGLAHAELKSSIGRWLERAAESQACFRKDGGAATDDLDVGRLATRWNEDACGLDAHAIIRAFRAAAKNGSDSFDSECSDEDYGDVGSASDGDDEDEGDAPEEFVVGRFADVVGDLEDM